MTITYADGFALLPKRCDCCNRLFWMEPYWIWYKTVGIEAYSLKQCECNKCHGKERIFVEERKQNENHSEN